MSDLLNKRLEKVLQLDWQEEDREVLVSAINILISYQKFIPNYVLKAIIRVIDIGIREKQELDYIKATDIF